MERELGLLRKNNTPKPVLGELAEFRKFIDRLAFDALPPRVIDAVCILSRNQDQWGVAYSSFVLAKQAGLDLEFQYEDRPLKEAPLYLLPAVSSHSPVSRRCWLQILDRVRAGATLYVSVHDGVLNPFGEAVGVEVQTRRRRSEPTDVLLDGLENVPPLRTTGPVQLTLKPTSAEVLGREADGNPVFTEARYGKGRIFFLAFGMEHELARTPGAFHAEDAKPYWQIYRVIANRATTRRIISGSSPFIGITEHPLDKKTRVIVLINYSPKDVNAEFAVASPWRLKSVLRGHRPGKAGDRLTALIPANDTAVLVVQR